MSRRRCGFGLWAIAALLAAAIPTWAQDYSIRAFVQPSQDVTEQQTVRLVIEAEGRGSPKLTVGGLGDLENLQVVGGPERVFNSTWANGRLTAKTSLVYVLLPRKAGTALVPPLAVEVDGQKYETKPIRLSVSAAPAGVPPGGRSGAQGRSAGDGADVFLRTQLGKKEAWVGESISLSLLLYAGSQIQTPNIASSPALSSFWVEDIDVDIEAEATRAQVEGRNYIVYPMIRKILVPQTSGSIEIEPFVMQIPVRVRTNDPFESLFSFGRTREIVRRSQPIELEVRPLPTAGRPEDFGGAVGEFALEVTLDREEAAVNDAVALKATVAGNGFLRAVAPPVLDAPPDIKVFDPKVSSSSKTVRGKLQSRKTWEWVLVPLVAGELDIPRLRFPFFDTATGRYEVLEGDATRLVVRQNGDRPEASIARGDIRVQRRDLAFIKPLRGSLRQQTERAHETKLYLALMLLPLAWAPVVVLIGRHRARLQRNRGLARARRARSRARQRLRVTAKRASTLDAATFHEEVARALVEYVADRFDLSAAGLTYELADELLASRGLDPDLRRRFRSCLETCDFARFVPASGAPQRRTEVLHEAEELIDRLEKAR